MESGLVLMEGESEKSPLGENTIVSCPSCRSIFPDGQAVCSQDGTILVLGTAAIFERKYKILERLGGGGMGVIYLARHLLLDKLVAIKMLATHATSDEATRRFQVEAKAATLLDHPNIVTCHDFGTTVAGQPYLVMDYVPGKTLAEVIKARGGLDIASCLRMSICVCEAMSHAHQRGVLHRDLKPGNIMLVSNEGDWQASEDYRILDFGIAKIQSDSAGGAQSLTKIGEAIGSPLYMSPEQVRGTKVDMRSDLYSLGCVMYESLVGIPPFSGETAFRTMAAHLSESVQPMRETSLGKIDEPALEAIVARLLEKDPDLRYQSMSDLRSDLLELEKVTSAKRKNMPVTSQTQKEVHRSIPPIKLATIGVSALLPIVMLTLGFQHITGGAAKRSAAVFHQIELLGPRKASVQENVSEHTTSDIPPAYISKEESTAGGDGAAINSHQDPLDSAIAVSLKPDSKYLRNMVRRNPRQIDLRFQGQAWDLHDEDLAPLEDARLTRTILLKDVEITDAGLEHLKALTLEHLDLEGTNVKHLHALAKMQSLEWLDLARTLVDTDGIRTLQGLHKLRKLGMQDCRIGDTDLPLFYPMKNLQTLILANCPLVTTKGVEKLQQQLPGCDIQFHSKESSQLADIRKLQLEAEKAVRTNQAAEAVLLYEEAISQFNSQALEEYPLLVELFKGQAHAQGEERDYRSAAKSITEALVAQQHVDDSATVVPLLWAQEADYLEHYGEIRQALSSRAFARKQFIKCAPKIRNLNFDRAAVQNHFALSMDCVKIRQLGDAEQAMKAALESMRNCKFSEDAFNVECEVALANALFDMGNYQKALPYYLAACRYYDAHPQLKQKVAYHELGLRTATALANVQKSESI